jgi:hypothetical protein
VYPAYRAPEPSIISEHPLNQDTIDMKIADDSKNEPLRKRKVDTFLDEN